MHQCHDSGLIHADRAGFDARRIADDSVARLIGGAAITLLFMGADKIGSYAGLPPIAHAYLGLMLGVLSAVVYAIEPTSEDFRLALSIWAELSIGYVAISAAVSGARAGETAAYIAVASLSLSMSLALLMYPPRS